MAQLTLVNIVGWKTETDDYGTSQVPVFDTANGDLNPSQYAIDGPNAIVMVPSGEYCTIPKELVVDGDISVETVAFIRSMKPDKKTK